MSAPPVGRSARRFPGRSESRRAPRERAAEPAATSASLDRDELVAGYYRAGNVDWDVGRFGPPPGSPGCRVDAGILRANGYR
jgi:hypothetical protein